VSERLPAGVMAVKPLAEAASKIQTSSARRNSHFRSKLTANQKVNVERASPLLDALRPIGST